MSQLDKNDYCARIGLDTHLSSYLKTHDQADYLLALVERLKMQKYYWGDIGKENVKKFKELKKRDREIKDAMELLIAMDIVDPRDLHYVEDIDLLLHEARSPSTYNKETRDKLWKELEDQGFTNIEKLIAAINTVVKDSTR